MSFPYSIVTLIASNFTSYSKMYTFGEIETHIIQFVIKHNVVSQTISYVTEVSAKICNINWSGHHKLIITIIVFQYQDFVQLKVINHFWSFYSCC